MAETTHIRMCPWLWTKRVGKVTESEILDFSGGPVVKTPHFHCKGHGYCTQSGSSTSCEMWPKKLKLEIKRWQGHFSVFQKQFFLYYYIVNSSVQFSSVAQSCPTLCDPMNRSTPGLPVHHQLPEFTQTHVHQVSDAIQPSHPLSSPSPPAPNPSQHQGLFQRVNSSHEVAKGLEFQL